ncbi:Maf family protein [Thiopseudomonas acetoxidans]|uniref:7-methyl-GTP pyrophosphatase n=1 Tax=Thiopseudomonas acetoxidans TaxID=3041622 RepID=A0ABT7SR19_9GAMM|nr:nucleoside triphosphate pyrophosphatase [Thiopseudomonas sp. CY1220]MDM7858002.1 nucleoside triphosphate pyrophosphatase [Thiopseudomonas sp. CY1220]
MRPLVLASSSVYRRELLQRLQLPFTSCSPNIDERPLADETPQMLVQRLAVAKARALRAQFLQHLIIGSDQVAVLDGQILSKPGTAAAAIAQLTAASGRSVTFYTGLCLLDSASGTIEVDCVPFTVHFRTLSPEQVSRYIEREQPLDCAGSFKSEGLGISLFRATEGEDATSLIGLPLIRLCDMLSKAGIIIP